MHLSEYKYVVVGSGFYGSVIAERIANDLVEPVLVIEKRSHTGGNCHSLDHPETGIHYHQYGTHIFHTKDRMVWEYVNRFTDFNGYRHQVLTTYQDKVFQMPINLETINSFYDLNLKPFEVVDFLRNEAGKSEITHPTNFEEKAISQLGEPLYKAFIEGYTKKQWGCDPKLLSASILNRLPFRTNYDESYFFDPWQGIPLKGYGDIFDKLLSHQLIRLEINTDFFSIRDILRKDAKIIYSGPIDKLFDYKHGRLEWRGLSLREEIKELTDFQGTSVMNYAEETIPYTRIHEPRHLHAEREYSNNQTLIIKEFSHSDNGEDPFYPLGGDNNKALVDKYQDEFKTQKNLIVGGRLGDYKYYDMDQTIAMALQTYSKLKEQHHDVE